MKKLSEYNNKKLCECFNCFNTKEIVDIAQTDIELKDKDGNISVTLEKGKFLSYYGTRFAKVDNNGIIHIFKDYM